MRVYIVVYTPTSSRSALHPVPSTHYVRVFLSDHEVQREDYWTYLNCLGLPHHLTNMEGFMVPATFSQGLLIPQDARATKVEGIEYDFTLEGDELLTYMEYVRSTVALENQRPTFSTRSKPPQSSSHSINTPQSLHSLHIPTVDLIRQSAVEWEAALSDIPVLGEVDPVLVFRYTDRKDSAELATAWQLIQQYVGNKVRYYIQQVRKADEEPHILWRIGFTGGVGTAGWLVVQPTVPYIESLLRPYYMTIHQLSTGHLIHEKPAGTWEMLLGTQVFPQITINSTLTLYKTFLTWKRPNQVLESWLREEERDVLKNLMQSSLSFSLEHAYGLFTTTRHSKLSLRAQSIQPKVFSISNVQPSDSKEETWESILPVVAPDSATVKKDLRQMLLEFQETSEGPKAPQDLQQYAFLLHLLQLNKDRSRDLEPVIQLYRQSKMDLQGTAVSLQQVRSLLSANTTFLEEGREEEEVLEARVFLELFQFPLEVRLPEQKTKLFRWLVESFAHQVLQATEGKRAAASQVWEAFLQFLRTKKLDFVGFFGSQMEFNEVLRDLGWEQKRIASGKVWVGLEVKQEPHTQTPRPQ